MPTPSAILLVASEAADPVLLSCLATAAGAVVQARLEECAQVMAAQQDLALLILQAKNEEEAIAFGRRTAPQLSIPLLLLLPVGVACSNQPDWAEVCLSGVEPAVLIPVIKALLRAGARPGDSALQWQTTFNAIADAVALLDAQGRIRNLNPAMAALLGRSVEQVRGRHLHDCLLESLGLFDVRSLPKVASRRRERAEFQAGGRFFLTTLDPIIAPNGEIQGGVKFISEITERKHSEQQLAEARNQLAAQLTEMRQLHRFSNRLAQGLALKDVLAELLSAVAGLQHATQGMVSLYDPEDQDLETLTSIGLPEAFLDMVGRIPTGTGAAGLAVEKREAVIVPDVDSCDEYAPFREAANLAGYRAVYATPIMTPEGEILGTITTYFANPHHPTDGETRLTEIYAHEAAEFIRNARDQEALRASETRFRRLFESNIVAIVRGVGPVCSEANQAYLDLIGATRDDLEAGRISWRAVTAPEYRELDERMARQLLEDGLCQPFEKELVRPDGTRVPVLVGAVVLDSPYHWMCLMIDQTQQRRAQEALRMNEKLAATGRLAASIAHEINNPMASVTNLLFLLGTNRSLDASGLEYLELAKQEVSRMTHIIKQMLGFYRESPQPVDVNLREIVESVVALYGRKLQQAQVTLTADFRFDGEVRAFPGEMRQVFANLLGNALEAVGQNGSIRLRICSSRDWRSRRHGVRVQISDSGPGIQRGHLARLFEPFFTTKGEKGTGLGLWVTHGILGKHGGSIRVRSCVDGPHRGTTFSIFLPIESAATRKEYGVDAAKPLSA